MRAFRAMNTDIAVDAPALTERAERALASDVEHLFHETERRFSRFIPDSELAHLNHATGPVTVSAELLGLLVRARAHALATGGIFEPAVGGALRACGYDRSFARGALDTETAPACSPPARIDQLEIDVARSRVVRPPHVEIDLGGFLKGATADRAAALAPEVVAIDAGGDAVLRGAPPGDPGWTIEIEDPHDAAKTIATLVVRDRAVATSAPNRRRWRRGDLQMHHILDPRTGRPAESDVLQATVIAPSAELADVMAKVAFVVGAERARSVLERRGASAVLVLANGEVRTFGDVELHHA